MGKIQEMARPSAPDEAAPTGAEPVGSFQRKTQSPLVWLNLHKSELPKTAYAELSAPKSVSFLSALPLDLPRELVMDVNKPPYPVVNIIADQPSAGSYKQLQSVRMSAL